MRAYGVAPRLSFLRSLLGATVEVGVDAEAQRFNTDLDFAAADAARHDADDRAASCSPTSRGRATRCRCAGYVAATMPLGRLKLEPGVRYAEYFEQGVARGAFEPRLAVRLALTPALSVDGTVGALLADAQPARRRRRLRGVRPRSDLGLQTSTQAALGVESRLPADLTLRLTGFYQWLLRQRHAQHVRSRRHGARVPRDAARPRLRRRADAAPARARRACTGWLAYTLSWSQRDFDGVFAPSDWDQRHILNLRERPSV